jgi:hypothetical protein
VQEQVEGLDTIKLVQRERERERERGEHVGWGER